MKKEEAKEVKVNQPEGAPVVSEGSTPVSRETLSHQWQKDSAAINTNELSGYAVSGENTLEKIAAQQDAKEVKFEAEKVSEAEYQRRIRLDVSDRDYINPSLDNVKVK